MVLGAPRGGALLNPGGALRTPGGVLESRWGGRGWGNLGVPSRPPGFALGVPWVPVWSPWGSVVAPLGALAGRVEALEGALGHGSGRMVVNAC